MRDTSGGAAYPACWSMLVSVRSGRAALDQLTRAAAVYIGVYLARQRQRQDVADAASRG